MRRNSPMGTRYLNKGVSMDILKNSPPALRKTLIRETAEFIEQPTGEIVIFNGLIIKSPQPRRCGGQPVYIENINC